MWLRTMIRHKNQKQSNVLGIALAPLDQILVPFNRSLGSSIRTSHIAYGMLGKKTKPLRWLWKLREKEGESHISGSSKNTDNNKKKIKTLHRWDEPFLSFEMGYAACPWLLCAQLTQENEVPFLFVVRSFLFLFTFFPVGAHPHTSIPLCTISQLYSEGVSPFLVFFSFLLVSMSGMHYRFWWLGFGRRHAVSKDWAKISNWEHIVHCSRAQLFFLLSTHGPCPSCKVTFFILGVFLGMVLSSLLPPLIPNSLRSTRIMRTCQTKVPNPNNLPVFLCVFPNLPTPKCSSHPLGVYASFPPPFTFALKK